LDSFFTRKHCERCGGPLDGGRIMSRLNEQTLCIPCSEKEKADPDYKKAVDADIAEIRKGNYNYKRH